MKHLRFSIALLMLASMLALIGCGKEEQHINVSSSQLEGLWQRNSTQEYWRYRADGTGVTWDESDDISEEESNLTFSWTIQVDRLTHVFSGEQGNQAVPKVYTIKAISRSSMRWVDDYKMEYNFSKVE